MMKRMPPAVLCVLAALMGICCVVVGADNSATHIQKANLIYNHSFERMGKHGSPDGWFGQGASLGTTYAHSGNRSLKLEPGAEVWAMGIASLPTLKYRISGFIRSQNIGNCGLVVSFYDRQGEIIRKRKIPAGQNGNEWIRLQKVIEVPFGAAGLCAGIYNDGDEPVHADDISALEWYQFRPPKTDNPPAIDGSLDDQCWNEASVGSEDWITINGRVAQQQTRVFCCYDDDHLYIGFRLYTSRPHDLKAVETRDDFYVWRDESAEVFIDPGHDHASYCELEVNSRNVEYDAWSFDRSWECIWEHEVGREDDAWICEMAIDLASFEYPDASGDPSGQFPLPEHGVWGINFSRNDSITGESSSWPNTGSSFHNTDRYGHMLAFEPLRTEEYTARARTRLQKLHHSLLPAEYMLGQKRSTTPSQPTADYSAKGGAVFQRIQRTIKKARSRLKQAETFEDWIALNTTLRDAEDAAQCLDDRLQPLNARDAWAQKLGQPVQMAVSLSATPVDPAGGCQGWRATTGLGLHLGRSDIAGFSAVIDGFGEVEDVSMRADVEGIGQLPVQIIEAPAGASNHESYRWPSPKIDLHSGERIVAWIPIQTGSDIPAGEYQGTLKVTGTGHPTLEQPFTVTVSDFQVPRSKELKLSVLSPDFTAADITAELAGYGVPDGSVAVWSVPPPSSGEGYSEEEIEEIVAEGREKCQAFDEMRPQLSGYILGVMDPDGELTEEYSRVYRNLKQALPDWPIMQIVDGEARGLGTLDPCVDIWALSGSAWSESQLGRDEGDQRWLYYELPAADQVQMNRLSDARIQPWVARYIEADGIVWGGASSGTPYPMFEMYCRMIALGHRDCDYFEYLDTLVSEGLREKAGSHWRLRSNARMALRLRGFSVLSPTEYDADYRDMRQRRIRCGKLIERVRRHLQVVSTDISSQY